MDASAIWTMTISDLRQRVRDRSVLIFGLVVPIALMFVFNLLFSGLTSSESLGKITVSVAAEPGDQIAQSLVGVLSSIDNLDVTATSVPRAKADELQSRVESGSITAGVIFPAGFDDAVRAGKSPEVKVLQLGAGGLEARVLDSIVSSYLDRVAASAQAANAASTAGLSASQLSEVAQAVAQAPPVLTAKEGTASDEQLTMEGYLVAGQAALFMFFTVGFGVIAYIAEREQGTLVRLASMPLPPRSIILAKVLVSLILGVAATSVLLFAGALFFGVNFGNFVPVGVLVLAAVTAVTSLVLVIIRVARTSEQAQGATAMVGILMGVLGGSFFPISGSGLLGKISDLTPTAAFIRGLGITSGGGQVVDLGAPLAVFAAFGIGALAISLALRNETVLT